MKRLIALALLLGAVIFQTACTKTETAPEATAPVTDPAAAAAPGSAAPAAPTDAAPAAPATDTTTTPPATH